MAAAQLDKFTAEQNQLARWAKALGHPGRLALLEVLIQKDACVCGELVSELPLAQATVSQHLAVLKEAGLVKGTISGPRVCYCVDAEGWEAARQALGAWFQQFPRHHGECC